MTKQFFVLAIVSMQVPLASVLHAQTNSFPSSGNAGVGITSPPLPFYVRTPANTSGVAWALGLNNPTNPSAVGYGVGLKLQNSTPESGGGEASKWAGIAAVAGSYWSNQTDLAFFTNSYDTGSNSVQAGIERMRIQGTTGNIGIGITTPTLPLYLRTPTNTTGIAWGMAVNNPANVYTPGYGVGIKLQNSTPESGGNEPAKWAGIAAVAGQYNSNQTDLAFYTNTFDSTNNVTYDATERIRIQGTTGNVGIGTTNPTEPLTVNGTIRAKEIVVDTGWSDYVFEPGYRLKPLSEVEADIQRDGHLPGIPSAKDVAAHGINLGDAQAKLLAKIEELTLHQIELEKRLEKQEKQLAELRAAK